MPRWFSRLRARIKYRRFEQDLAAELETHRAMKETDLVESGLGQSDAHWQAVRELGSTAVARSNARAVWVAPWVDGVLHDARHALRLLGRNRAFTLVASLTLALGVGANSVVFSVVDAALLRPLPYRNPDRLVDVFRSAQMADGGSTFVWADGRYAERLRAIKQVFEGIEAYSGSQRMSLATGSEQSPLVGAFTPGLPDFLGVKPQLGRCFTQADVAGRDVIVISNAYWQRAFNRDPGVLGKTIVFADRVCTIVGVMPPTFRALAGAYVDAWLPVAERDGESLVARLRPGLSVERARRELRAAFSEAPRGSGAPQIDISVVGWNRGRAGGEGRDPTRAMLFSLFGAVGLLLIVACANVANLLLSRTFARQGEVAIRRALGATRVHLIRQFLIEGLMLAGLGGIAAVVLAWWGIKVIPAIVPRDLVASVLGVTSPVLDVRVFVFGSLTAVITGVFCGLVPGLHASRAAEPTGVLAGRQPIRGWSRRQRRLQAVFQAVQFAMTLVLLAAAGLLMASLLRMVTMPTGFDPKNLAYADIAFPRESYRGSAEREAFFDRLLGAICALPGVRADTVGPTPVYTGPEYRFVPADAEVGSPRAAFLEAYFVRPDYFRVASIPLKEGRTFGPEDRQSAPPVAIISENVARLFWPGQNVIGRQFRGLPPHESTLVTVVGVVAHVRTVNLRRDGVEVYFPSSQTVTWPGVLIRLDADGKPALAAVRGQVMAIDPRVTVPRLGMVSDMFNDYGPLATSRFYAVLVGVFACLALVTAAVGLYGTLSYSVSRRAHEIGVRLALGADVGRVRWLVVADALAPVGAGVVAGLGGAIGTSRLIGSQLYRTASYDPLTLGAVVFILATVCVVAALVPARRATRVDPAETLRVE
jgi:putative ABC transport system permease protein